MTLSDLLTRALEQELDERTRNETDPAEAIRAAERLDREVRAFIEGQGQRIAFRLEEASDADSQPVRPEPAFLKHLPPDAQDELREFLKP